MSERKVLNKYYPPDFDPSKIPKLRLAKERQYTVRIMAPFNMQCKMCNEYIYKGKKFNAKTENIHDENYLGLRKYRFYIRCPRCISEVVFKTDPENTDYTLEQGATRLFEAAKLYQAAEEAEKKQAEEDAQNPMKVLENRTKDSKLEMEVMENLEELRELNMRQSAINHEEILRQGAELEAQHLKEQEEEDEAEIRRIFGKDLLDGIVIKRVADDEENEDDDRDSGPSNPSPSTSQHKRPTDVLTDDSPGPSAPKKQKTMAPPAIPSTKTSSKSFLSGLVKVKGQGKGSQSSQPTSSSDANARSTNATPTTSKTSAPTTEGAISASAASTACVVDTTSNSSGGTTGRVDVDSSATDSGSAVDSAVAEESNREAEEDKFRSSIMEGLQKQKAESTKVTKERSIGLSLLGGYDFSDSDSSSDS